MQKMFIPEMSTYLSTSIGLNNVFFTTKNEQHKLERQMCNTFFSQKIKHVREKS